MSKIAFLEPFYSGSHLTWLDQLMELSQHESTLFSMPGRFWKWRSYGGAVTLAKMVNESKGKIDLFVASDMLDVATFKGLLLPRYQQIPLITYFHENQFSYPWVDGCEDMRLKRDQHYAFKNLTTAHASEQVLFNSEYNRSTFLKGAQKLLTSMPDYRELEIVDDITAKSQVLPLGLDLRILASLDRHKGRVPRILWNHRWEHDKNPDQFFELLFTMKEKGFAFELVVLGQGQKKYPAIFKEAQERLKDHIVQWGHCKSYQTYCWWLRQCDIIPVTSVHDFFGISVVEAIYAGAYPILPKRLAYPEHINSEEYPQFFYEQEQELEDKLEALLIDGVPEIFLSEKMERYDWRQLISTYDDIFKKASL